jgi:hypothetical protein
LGTQSHLRVFNFLVERTLPGGAETENRNSPWSVAVFPLNKAS